MAHQISTPDAVIARRAAKQLGLISRRQALAAGLDRNQIQYRLRSERWTAVAAAVYRLDGVPGSWQQDILAACLSLGRDAVASHLSAGALWSICLATSPPHVTVLPGTSARSPCGVIHRGDLRPRDRTRIGPIPVTSLPRTLLDCAALTTGSPLHDMVDAAMAGGRTSLRAMDELLGRAPIRGREGAARRSLMAALEPWMTPIKPESPAEVRLLRRLGEWGVPAPTLQHEVRSPDGRLLGRLDLAWVASHVGVEYDGMAWHGPRRIEADELRHQALRRAGWTVLHADRLDLRPGVDRLANEILDALHRTPQRRTALETGPVDSTAVQARWC